MNRRRASASYVARASSGRPGSPHRYFEGSYDVILELMTGEGNGDDARKSGPSPDGDTTDDQPTLARVGRQVVHRHKNGLCIVTAVDVLERMVILWIDETNERNNDFGPGYQRCLAATILHPLQRYVFTSRLIKMPNRPGVKYAPGTKIIGREGISQGTPW